MDSSQVNYDKTPYQKLTYYWEHIIVYMSF